ncbi:conserved Plasmodium protein, unknown function, partial [Plasmodium malariae]
PVDLPFERKLNLGLRKYKHNFPYEPADNYMQNEMNEDAKELTDVIHKTNFPGREAENYSIPDEVNYEHPQWLEDMIRLSNKSKDTLESLGLENLPDVNVCKQIKHIKEQMLCILEALEDIKEVYQNGEYKKLANAALLAVRALSRLKTLASTFENRQL